MPIISTRVGLVINSLSKALGTQQPLGRPLSISLAVILSALASVPIAVLVLMLTRRRHPIYVRLDPETIPEISGALPLISGLTESTMHPGNSAKIFQDGDLFPAMLEDIARARHTVHV
jgi:hypothetical protein